MHTHYFKTRKRLESALTFKAFGTIVSKWLELLGDPKGTRTPVTGVRGRCPRPLDDGAKKSGPFLKYLVSFVKLLLCTACMHHCIIKCFQVT